MAIFNVFKKPQIRQFHIEPRFYDERKEAMQERRERIRKELSEEKSAQHSLSKGYLQEKRTIDTSSNSWLPTLFFSGCIAFVLYVVFF